MLRLACRVALSTTRREGTLSAAPLPAISAPSPDDNSPSTSSPSGLANFSRKTKTAVVRKKRQPPIPPELSRELYAALREEYFEEDSETALKAVDTDGISRFRKIVYDEGELDNSDLSLPPSRTNPHPLDTSTLPPTRSRSFAPYVNHVPLLQKLVELGVDLLEIETKNPAVPRHLLRLNPKEASDKLRWLVSIGVEPAALGEFITRNPFFLLQDLDDMKARVNFLTLHKFSKRQIVKLITEFRYWLNIDVKTTESRFEWIRGHFSLSEHELRILLAKEPRVISFGMAPLKRLFDVLTCELGFTPKQVKKMLLVDPRLFMMDPRAVVANFVYATRVMSLQLPALVEHTLLLRVALSSLRTRHEFLRRINKSNYMTASEAAKESAVREDPPNPSSSSPQDESATAGQQMKQCPQPRICLSDLLVPSDADFAERVARVTAASYDIFQRSR